MLTRLARAQRVAALGDLRDTVMRAATLAQRAGLADAMAEALLLSSRLSFDRAQLEDPEKIALLEDVDRAARRSGAPRPRAQAALAVELIFVGDTRRFALLDEALAVARSSGDPLALVDTAHARFNARSRATWFGEDQVAEHDLHFERLAAAEALDDPFWLTTALMGGAIPCDGDVQRAGTARRASRGCTGSRPGSTPPASAAGR